MVHKGWNIYLFSLDLYDPLDYSVCHPQLDAMKVMENTFVNLLDYLDCLDCLFKWNVVIRYGCYSYHWDSVSD